MPPIAHVQERNVSQVCNLICGNVNPQKQAVLPRCSKTALISRETRKESQMSSVTKLYSVGFKYDAELLCKNEFKR